MILGAILFFSIWFILSVLMQFDFQLFEKYKRLDYFRLLPRWTFFAPNPGKSDHHIICRDKLYDGTITDWRDITPIWRRRMWSIFWNPEKREVKVISDAVASIIEFIHSQAIKGTSIETIETLLLVYPPYLLLLNLVIEKEPPIDSAVHRQFAIIERFGFTSDTIPNILIKSPFHSWN